MKIFILFSLLISSTVFAASNIQLSNERMKEIKNLVKQDCGSCHGLTLKGGLGPNLNPERLKKYPHLFISATITHGRPGTPMPPWAALLTPEEIDYIATQLKQGNWYEP